MSYCSYPYGKGYKFNPCNYCRLNSQNLYYGDNVSYQLYRSDAANTNGVQLGEQNLAPSKFRLSYPFVTNMANKDVEAKINRAIVDEVARLFKENVLRPEQTDFTEVLLTYEVKLNQDGLLSILFSIYTYVYHAAHGMTIYSSLTFNLETGQIYNFKDLFTAKIYYKPILDDKAKEYIKNNDVPMLTEFQGIQSNQQFYMTPDKLVIYYQLYAYTPYAYGLFEIPIPYSEITNLLGPASPIQKMLK